MLLESFQGLPDLPFFFCILGFCSQCISVFKIAMDPGQLFIDVADVVRCELFVFLTAQCIDVECYCGWRIGLSELREALVVESFFLVLLLCMLLSFFFGPSRTLLTHVLRRSPPALRLIRATDEKKGCVLRMDPSILDRMCGYHVVLCALTHRTMHGLRLACCSGGVKPCAANLLHWRCEAVCSKRNPCRNV